MMEVNHQHNGVLFGWDSHGDHAATCRGKQGSRRISTEEVDPITSTSARRKSISISTFDTVIAHVLICGRCEPRGGVFFSFFKYTKYTLNHPHNAQVPI